MWKWLKVIWNYPAEAAKARCEMSMALNRAMWDLIEKQVEREVEKEMQSRPLSNADAEGVLPQS